MALPCFAKWGKACGQILTIVALLLSLQLVLGSEPQTLLSHSQLVTKTQHQAAGGRKLLQGDGDSAEAGDATGPQLVAADGGFSVATSRRVLSPAEAVAQVNARAAYFALGGPAGQSLAPPTGGGPHAASVTQVDLGGGYNFIYTFTMDVTIGTPGVVQTVVVDTGSEINWVQGPQCRTCCANGNCPQGQCPVSGVSSSCASDRVYDDSASSTKAYLDCNGACKRDDMNGIGCDYWANYLGINVQNHCEYGIGYGRGYSVGFYASDIVSLNGELSARINFGESVLEDTFASYTHGIFGFGPIDVSYPQQLKAQGAVPSSTFALCLDGGQSQTGDLFLGGAPSLAGLTVQYVPLKVKPNYFWVIDPPTSITVGTTTIPTGEAPGVEWIVDSGTTLTQLPSTIYSSVLAAIQASSNCPVTHKYGSLDYIILEDCTPPIVVPATLIDNGNFDDATLAGVYARFPTMTMTLNGATLTSLPQAYLFNFATNGAEQVVVSLGIISTSSASNNIRIIGDSFMNDNLIVFDSDNSRVGFSAAPFPNGCSGNAFGGLDPHFELRNMPGLGVNQTMEFDFQGFPDKSYCMVTDSTLALNAHMSGIPADATVVRNLRNQDDLHFYSDGTWMTGIGILYLDSEGTERSVTIELDRVAMINGANPFIVTVDGMLIDVKKGESSSIVWSSQDGSATLRLPVVSSNALTFALGGRLQMLIDVGQEEELIADPPIYFFNVEIKKITTTNAVHGFLGQMYAPGAIAQRLAMGTIDGFLHREYVDGTDEEYQTSGLASPDCAFNRFAKAPQSSIPDLLDDESDEAGRSAFQRRLLEIASMTEHTSSTVCSHSGQANKIACIL